MKTHYLLGGLAAFTMAAAAGLSVQAQPASGPGRDGPPAAERGGPPTRMGRPRLSPEERKKILAERFAKMDANRDGRVTFEEFHAAREAARLERQKAAFSRLTGGKDVLTLDQLERFADRRGPRGPMRGGGDRF